MDYLPDQLVWEILSRIKKTVHRNSISLSCKRLYDLDNEQRQSLRVGCGLDPANEALTSLCNRFPNLQKVEITYSGWMSKLGKQLDDQGLAILANNCPLLTDLTLSYCTFITDVGLRSLATCSKLSALKLNFTPRITGCGCLNVTSVEWLEYLGRLESLEELSIKNCRAIGEGDLMKLGASCLVSCIISPGRGLACVLGKCKNLEKIHLDMCVGVRDSDIITLAKNSSNLHSLSLRVPSDFSLPLLMGNPLRLTDESLKAVAEHCRLLESIRICFSDGEFPSFSSFTLEGILILIQMCPIRELALDHVHCFNDAGMEGLCLAQSLEALELVGCHEVTDEGLQLVAQFPGLKTLRLKKCLGITNDGLEPLVGSYKLELLAVEDCPQISERAVHGAAKTVSFRQDLSWMY
ncbi:unnamed protein product [Linum tenue]|uniref:F-box/LRR-repeat protein 14 n=1 Tax=Linum tenue TaxID=586396 RepID=A0AAV0J235_9ROSI|nr:unnamed protein product [Linum tenue]